MSHIVKPLSTEISVTTANTVSNARVVRVVALANTLLTLANTANYASLSVLGGNVEYVEKQASDTIQANVAANMTSVAFRN